MTYSSYIEILLVCSNMAYYKQILAVVLICLSFLYNYRIQGLKFVKVEGGQNEAKVYRMLILEYVIWQNQVIYSIFFVYINKIWSILPFLLFFHRKEDLLTNPVAQESFRVCFLI